jgi:hypothetical protein
MLNEDQGRDRSYGPNPSLIRTDMTHHPGARSALAGRGIAEIGNRGCVRHWKLRCYRKTWCAVQKHWELRFIRVSDDQELEQFVR